MRVSPRAQTGDERLKLMCLPFDRIDLRGDTRRAREGSSTADGRSSRQRGVAIQGSGMGRPQSEGRGARGEAERSRSIQHEGRGAPARREDAEATGDIETEGESSLARDDRISDRS